MQEMALQAEAVRSKLKEPWISMVDNWNVDQQLSSWYTTVFSCRPNSCEGPYRQSLLPLKVFFKSVLLMLTVQFCLMV